MKRKELERELELKGEETQGRDLNQRIFPMAVTIMKIKSQKNPIGSEQMCIQDEGTGIEREIQPR